MTDPGAPGPAPDEVPPEGAPDGRRSRDDTSWRVLQGAAVLLVFALFLYSLRGLLNPFLLFWLLVAVLVPFRHTRGHSLLVALTAVLTLLWILDTTGFLLAPFVLALVLAYMLDPLVDLLVARGLPRTPAIGALALPVLAGLALLLFFGVPAAGKQIGELIQRAPVFLGRMADWLESARERLAGADLPLVDEEALIARIRSIDTATVVSALQERQSEIARQIWSGVLGLGRGLGSVLSVVGYVVLTPVLTFYLLRDYDRLVERMRDLLPARSRDEVVSFFAGYDDLLSRYLRGQITVALTVGAITALGLWIAQFPYAFLLGLLVAVFSVVPYMGLVLSLIPAVFIALVSGSVWLSLLKVGVVYAVAQGLEGAVISPRIVGGSVGLHPVWVVLALAVGGFFFGFVGLLIAVPVAVGVKLLVLEGVERYRASELYRAA